MGNSHIIRDVDILMNDIFPISEIFGPTIQGEGIHAGRLAIFVRFAGCDSHCEWCDTKYAWDVKAAKQMTAAEIMHEIVEMTQANRLVVLTGGNPALYNLTNLIAMLKSFQVEVHVETQGTVFPEWLMDTDFISFSPKSLEPYAINSENGLPQMVTMLNATRKGQLKFVIGDESEYQYARTVAKLYPNIPMIFQAKTGTQDALEGFRKLAIQMCNDKRIPPNVRVIPQMHKIIWGDKSGI